MSSDVISRDLKMRRKVQALMRSTMRFITIIAYGRPHPIAAQAMSLGRRWMYAPWVMRSVLGKPVLYSCPRKIAMSSQKGSGWVNIPGLRKNMMRSAAARKSAEVRKFLKAGLWVSFLVIELQTKPCCCAAGREERCLVISAPGKSRHHARGSWRGGRWRRSALTHQLARGTSPRCSRPRTPEGPRCRASLRSPGPP